MTETGHEKLHIPAGPEMAKLAKAVFEKNQQFSFIASGNSMWPFIRNMDRVTLAPFRKEQIKTGHIVGFSHPATGNFLLHRIIAVQPGRLLIKGDNHKEPDGWVPEQNLIGIVTGIKRSNRNLRTGITAWLIPIALLSRTGILRPAVRICRFFCAANGNGQT